MFATYLTVGLSTFAIAVMFALALCNAASRGEEQY